eukprot:jgi/Botrbrau1/7917/Bobra.9_2s0085.1
MTQAISKLGLHGIYRGKLCLWLPPALSCLNKSSPAYKYMGASKKAMVELTGATKQEERLALWSLPHMRFYFATPQTFKNDVCQGVCPCEKVVCLVVDECHKATGRHDSVLASPPNEGHLRCKFRLLGLSATPGSNREAIQGKSMVVGPRASAVLQKNKCPELRLPAYQPAYVHTSDEAILRYAGSVDEPDDSKIEVETVVVSPSAELSYCRDTLLALIRSVISRLVALKVYNGSVDAETASAFAFKLAGDKLRAAGRPAADAATVQSFLKQKPCRGMSKRTESKYKKSLSICSSVIPYYALVETRPCTGLALLAAKRRIMNVHLHIWMYMDGFAAGQPGSEPLGCEYALMYMDALASNQCDIPEGRAVQFAEQGAEGGGCGGVQAHFLTMLREVLDSYGIEQALDLLDQKSSDIHKMPTLTSNSLFWRGTQHLLLQRIMTLISMLVFNNNYHVRLRLLAHIVFIYLEVLVL